MHFTLEQAGGANLVRGWEPGRLRINDEWFDGAVLIAASTVAVVAVSSPDELDQAALASAFALEPEVLLVGTGAAQCFLDAGTMRHCLELGVGLEVMDTLAAARTYNVLVGEGRRVVAVLLPPDA